MSKDNFVDSTTLHGIESLFRSGSKDPWGSQLAGYLADLFIYSDRIRYPVPDRGSAGAYDIAEVDSLVQELRHRDSEAVHGHHYSTAQPRVLADEHLSMSFQQFATWARSNTRSLKKWLAFHHEPWILSHRQATTPHENAYTFDLGNLLILPELAALEASIGVPRTDICYAFDNVLKYPIFGELTGSTNRYLNHGIRDSIILPTVRQDVGYLPSPVVTFAESVSAIAPSLSREEYSVLLHELRGLVRYHGLHLLPPGEVDKENLREIAAKAKLPPRVSQVGKAMGVVGGVICGLGAINPLAAPMAIVGAIISISTAIWTETLPRSVANIQWLRWALTWDIEKQAEQRDV